MGTTLRWTAGLLAAGLPLVAGAEYAEMDVKDGGAIVGTIKLNGEAPAPGKKAIPAEMQKDCNAKEAALEELLVKDGAVQNAVVALEAIDKGKKKPAGPIVMDQKGCAFLTHVQPVVVGTPVEFRNGDVTMHNVKIEAFKNPTTNQAIVSGGAPLTWTPTAAEKVRVECSVHPWMGSWLAIFDHPYFAVTDAEGKFRIDQVPPGTYKVKIWHEKLGLLKTEKDGVKTMSFEVKVEAGKDAVIELPAYSMPKN